MVKLGKTETKSTLFLGLMMALMAVCTAMLEEVGVFSLFEAAVIMLLLAILLPLLHIGDMLKYLVKKDEEED